MIIPIGHEQSDTRRIPWVSASVIVLCMGAWIATLYQVAQMPSLPPAHYREQAHEYWLEHPFLNPDAELAIYMLVLEEPDAIPKEELTQADWELWLVNKRMAKGKQPPEDAGDVEALQNELERLTEFGFYLAADEIPPEGNGPHREWGLIPAEASVKTFFSHMFMHGSWAHILGNLFLFFLVAPALEDRWGRPLFTAFYLGAGLFAGGFHMALSLGSPIPLVGASGAIAGAMGAFLVLFWKTRIKFLYAFLFIPPIWGTFHVGAWLALPLWFGNEMLSAWITHSTGVSTGVAYWAHVGGFLFGSLFAVTVKGLRLEERFLARAIEDKVIRGQGKAVLEQARRAIDEQVYEEAFLLLQQEVALRPNDPEVLLLYWEAAVAFYQPEAGAKPLATWIRGQLSTGKEAAVADVWARAVAISPKLEVDPNVLVPVAAWLHGKDRSDEAKTTLQYILSDSHPGLRGGTILRARELAKSVDPSIECRALERILAVADLPGPKRERAEAELAALREKGVEPCVDPLADEPRVRGLDESGAVAIDIDDGGSQWQEPRHVVAAEAEANALPPTNQPLDAEALHEDTPELGALPGEAVAEPSQAIAMDVAEPEPSPAIAMDVADPEPSPAIAIDVAEPSLAIGMDVADPEPPVAIGVDDIEDEIAIGEVASLPRFASAKLVDVVPVALATGHIAFQKGDGGTMRLGFDRVQAVSAAVVSGLAAKPVLVIDLLLNWNDLESGTLKGARVRSDRFDPRKLVEGQAKVMPALHHLLTRLVQGSGGDALPTPAACVGKPFSRFESLAEYEREVLQIDG